MIQRQRLLLVDDDPVIRTTLTQLLSKDFFVTSASHGEEGYSLAVANPPVIIVLDLQMPGWNGIKTLRALRDNPKLSEIPVLILAAEASRSVVIEVRKLGANDFLIKNSELRETIVPRVKGILRKPRQAAAIPPSMPSPQAVVLTNSEWNQSVKDLATQELAQNFEDGF